ncbi:hypothetical protein FMM74_016865 [Lachnospiraceae bacterium MD308]|nr:hypothetical protein [Lachnospiraceae bacterium MD308]
MKNRMVRMMMVTMTTVLLIGCNSITVKEYHGSIKADNISNILSNVVNSVSDSITANNEAMEADKGLHGWDNTEVYFTRTKNDYDAMTEILKNRNGKIIIEVIEAIVLDNDGNGSDQFGFYVKYDSKQFSKGDKVQSVFVYNPDSNYIDDILYRVDTLVE